MAELKQVFGEPQGMVNLPHYYCPGCGHGVVNRMIMEVINELDIAPKVNMVTSIGCSVRMWHYMPYDTVQAAHGRAPAVATGLRRAIPNDRVIFTYQGDGDLASIGMAEIIHAAARGEKFTVFFVNNSVFGMTGGQIAPTTLIGQKTVSCPTGRDPLTAGFPIRVAEMLAGLEGTAYVARVGTYDPQTTNRARAAIKKALQVQINGDGFSMVEFLSACPTNLHLTPVETVRWMRDDMVKAFPLGEFKVSEEVQRWASR